MQADKQNNIKHTKISKQTHIIEQIGENGDMQYNCTACRKVFRSRSQKYYHINCNQLQNLQFKCQHCDKSFARRTQWRYHNESHISPVNECPQCQKIFSNPLALKKHLNLHKAEPKVCPHCDKTFKKKTSLKHHISAQHLNHQQYGCAHCNKKYASKSTLQLHLQTHEDKRFACKFCGKLFQRNSILNVHLKRHNNANSYKCTVCQKTFSESSALARHNKIHQETVLQYYCSVCDKSILRKDNMIRHLTTIHPDQNFEDIVTTVKPLSTQQTAVDKSYLTTESRIPHETFEMNKPIKNFPRNLTNKTTAAEHPLVNYIAVITSVTSYNTENIQQDYVNQHKNQEKTDSVVENQEICHQIRNRKDDKCDLIRTETEVVNQRIVNTENRVFFNNHLRKNTSQFGDLTVEQQSGDNQDFTHSQKNESRTPDNILADQQQSVENQPTAPQAFSSVIKSIGNVKKNLNSNVSSITAIHPTSTEYKHKKYGRNNYNIDLYRKILGCDEDDENYEDENITQQQKYDNVAQSSTPVHWRKCFKNIYETSVL